MLLIVLLRQPRWILSGISWVAPGVTYFAYTHQRVVALTIDDGPDADTTPQILDVLKRHNVRATFFLISSRVAGNEAIVSQIISEGHEIGNHLTQDAPSILLSPEQFEFALLEAHATLSCFAHLRWLRPASGWYNARMIETTQAHHYQVALGSIFPFDTHLRSTWFASHHILMNIYPGAIVVLHDTKSRGRRTAATLEAVLPALHRRGYQCVTLSDLFSA
ncbi:chitin deacetylase family protein [Leptolyngbya sp. FACHB-36]|uniref:chitin deacetylase family protein n=1 Tax=Leptolyngbya sp. FACHB-36 TaxID=2692808 RepID=UPI001F554706|nr:chitin deacetylase family protein [Leptolyngbya sp. FACHB-36]